MAKFPQRKSNRRNPIIVETVSAPQVVEIARNPIEQKLLDLKHWLQDNASAVRYAALGVLLFLALVLFLVFFHSLRVEKHSAQLYSLLGRLQIAKTQEAKNILLPEAEELCQTWWSTSVSRNSCLLSSVILGQDKKYAEMLPLLDRFNSSASKKNALAVTLFYQAIAAENAGDLKAATDNFKQLEKYLSKTQNQDIAVFHQARILYQEKKWAEAQTLFANLLKNSAASDYAQEAKKYLLLIAVQQNQNPKP